MRVLAFLACIIAASAFQQPGRHVARVASGETRRGRVAEPWAPPTALHAKVPEDIRPQPGNTDEGPGLGVRVLAPPLALLAIILVVAQVATPVR